MFFNILCNTCNNLDKLESKLRVSLRAPRDERAAANQIVEFAEYVSNIASSYVSEGNDPRGAPKKSSVPFFLSYFWHVQNRDEWPVFYTSSVQTMQDLDLWVPRGTMSENYLEYKSIHHQLSALFSKVTHGTFNLYDVEHVFWFKGGKEFKSQNSSDPVSAPRPEDGVSTEDTSISDQSSLLASRLPDSYVPPIIAVLPKIAANDAALRKAAQATCTIAFHGLTEAYPAFAK